MTNAYSEIYVNDARASLAQVFDYLINDSMLDAGFAMQIFASSDYAAMFEHGNPSVVAGMSGIELGKAVFRSVFRCRSVPRASVNFDRSPEYWAGWVLAEYQWHSGRTFSDILERVSPEELLSMYAIYHEMDISRFIREMDSRCSKTLPETRLKKIRQARGLSQSRLARESGVGLRSIQMYEQRINDIDKAQVQTVYKLARAIGCNIEDLLETPME